MVLNQADVRIVALSLRRGEQDQARRRTGGEMRLAIQFAPDASSLERHIDGHVGQIGTAAEIRNGTRHADKEPVLASSCHDDIGIGEHPRHRCRVVYRPSFGERRAPKDVDEVENGKVGFGGIPDVHCLYAHTRLTRSTAETSLTLCPDTAANGRGP